MNYASCDEIKWRKESFFVLAAPSYFFILNLLPHFSKESIALWTAESHNVYVCMYACEGEVVEE
jgi:hypothetical protein